MAPTIKLDPHTYYAAAKSLSLLADQTVLPFLALHNALHDNPGMAGNYSGVQTWTTPYDTQVEDFHQSFTTYTNALQHFGDVLNAAGYNWDIANYNADTNPTKGPAPDKPSPATEPLIKSGLTPPPSAKSGDTRPGLDEGPLHGLFAKITHPVPNGDLGKLTATHDAWTACAHHDAITNAAGHIKQLRDTFTDTATIDPHLTAIQDHLTTLSTAADHLARASNSLATAVSAHRDQLQSLRTTLSHDRNQALIAIGATVVAFAALWCVTVLATDGLGAAATGEEAGLAGAATDAEVTTAATAISSDIATSTFPSLLAEGSETFSAISQFTKADAQLLAIQALIVATTSADSGGSSTADTGEADKAGQPTPTDRIKEHLTDRDLDAARRELKGEVVARKPDGTPWDHVDEVKNAQTGLIKRIAQLNKRLSWPGLSDQERPLVEDELSEASRLLDHSEQFVPR
ncbi:polymorphic toxin type 28 domain-containing protein [Nocardia alni]|uniref:polymorphic toxin type 28 domain-containing protein n=1 Tax=Nocardia alni TaxID=2815723 RepID=UPI0027E04933|nr:polymorphic toxin type 28 domain-containing protein [Nocardia alni]